MSDANVIQTFRDLSTQVLLQKIGIDFAGDDIDYANPSQLNIVHSSQAHASRAPYPRGPSSMRSVWPY